MKLSITSRLTITSALVTLVCFAAAGAALYHSVASGIRAEGIRSAESVAWNLRGAALGQLDSGLMVEYKGGGDPLAMLALDVRHWALVRGDGRVVKAHGDLFPGGLGLVGPGSVSDLVVDAGQTYRIARMPFLEVPQDELASLPEGLREVVRQLSPCGAFLRAKRQTKRDRTVVEVVLLEPEHLVELELGCDGEILDAEIDAFESVVPADLAASIVEGCRPDSMRFAAWRAYRGQLIAIVDADSAQGGTTTVAVNRLGERFGRDGSGEILGPEAASRLWVVTATDGSGEVFATQRVLATLAAGLPVLWGAVVLVAWYATRRAMSPVKRIVDMVQRVEVSRLDERLPVGNVEDELNRIAATINKMLDRVEDGYTREKHFTADASHELRGPLAKVLADIDIALTRERSAPEYRDTLQRCRSYARGMQHLLDSLLWLARWDARREGFRVQPFDVTDLVAETVRLLPEEQASRVTVDLAGAGTAICAHGAPDLVGVMLQNLLQNSLRYSPPRSPVSVRVAAENGNARIDVEDCGDGIPEDQIGRVFSRFVRVDKSRSRDTGGSGLGLAIVNEIAQAHGTSVELANVPAGGLRASFRLPVSGELTAAANADRAEDEAALAGRA